MAIDRTKDLQELARLCTLDSGVEVTSADVRRYLLVGGAALGRFSPEDRHEIVSTLLKEMADAC